jgi:hypothetical protein
VPPSLPDDSVLNGRPQNRRSRYTDSRRRQTIGLGTFGDKQRIPANCLESPHGGFTPPGMISLGSFHCWISYKPTSNWGRSNREDAQSAKKRSTSTDSRRKHLRISTQTRIRARGSRAANA